MAFLELLRKKYDPKFFLKFKGFNHILISLNIILERSKRKRDELYSGQFDGSGRRPRGYLGPTEAYHDGQRAHGRRLHDRRAELHARLQKY